MSANANKKASQIHYCLLTLTKSKPAQRILLYHAQACKMNTLQFVFRILFLFQLTFSLRGSIVIPFQLRHLLFLCDRSYFLIIRRSAAFFAAEDILIVNIVGISVKKHVSCFYPTGLVLSVEIIIIRRSFCRREGAEIPCLLNSNRLTNRIHHQRIIYRVSFLYR